MNRGNCNCRMFPTERNQYINELNDTCDCMLPCYSCECVDLTGTCPPCPPQETDPPCVPINSCSEKPKKSFWQMLFGDKKCSPCFKKKQAVRSKPTKKLRCQPCCNCNSNNDVCNNNRPNNPNCRCNSEARPQKGCTPTKHSVFGGHFYLNVENRPRVCLPKVTGLKNAQVSTNASYEKSKQTDKSSKHDFKTDNTPKKSPYKSYDSDKTTKQYSYKVNEKPVKDNLAEVSPYKKKRDSIRTDDLPPYSRKPITHPHGFGESKSRPNELAANMTQRRGSISQQQRDNKRTTSFADLPEEETRRRSSCKSGSRNSNILEDTPSKKSIHIGVVFTKEETKYFMPDQTVMSSGPDEVICCDNKDVQVNNSNKSSEQILTLEINGNGVKLQEKDKSYQSEDSKRLSDTIDDDFIRAPQNVPSSESFSREVKPLLEKKTRESLAFERHLGVDKDETEENLFDEQIQKRSLMKKSINSRRRSNTNLNQRVSEILEKLSEIEKKISCIEKKEPEKKEICVDIEGNKSTVSLHIKDPPMKTKENRNSYQVFNYNTSSKNGGKNMPTVIEIRHTKSKSHSPVRDSLDSSKLVSHTLETNGDGKQPNNKIIIKIPNTSTKTNCLILPENNSSIPNKKCDCQLSWQDVAGVLKNCSTKEKCYCFECVHERVKCYV